MTSSDRRFIAILLLLLAADIGVMWLAAQGVF